MAGGSWTDAGEDVATAALATDDSASGDGGGVVDGDDLVVGVAAFVD